MKKLLALFALLASASFAQVSMNPGAQGSFALKSNGSAPGAATGGLTIFEVDNAGVERRNVLAKLSDDFIGPSLSAVWTPVPGNNGVTPSIFVSDSGILSLTTVASAAAASATTQVGSELNWRAIRGNLVMETRLKLDTSSTQAVFAGFANTKSYVSGGVVGVSRTTVSAVAVTSGTGNFVGIVFDASTSLPALVTTTQPTFRFGGNKDSVSTTMADTGLSPNPANWYTLRTAVNPNGRACFSINEKNYGCVENAVSTTAPLTPMVGVTTRTNTAHNLNVDYIQVQQAR